MADSIFSQNPLDDAIAEHTTPKQKLDPRSEIEKIAIETNVPVNVLIAVNEQFGSNTPEQSVNTARQTAARISEGMNAGQDVEAVIRGFIGNDEAAGRFLDRARAIGNELYPLQEGEQANEGSLVGDMARQVGGGIVKGAGHIVEGAGRAVDMMRPQAPELQDDGQGGQQVIFEDGPSQMITGSRAAAERVRLSGEGLQAGVSDGARAAITGSTPDGDIFKPSTWTLGEDPSLKGYMLLGGDVLGSFLPVVATAMATGGVGATVTGGLQGGGAASETAGDVVDAAAKEVGESGKSRLEEESAYFRELLADGKTPEQAIAITKEAATKYAALLTAPVSAFGGAATSKILSGGVSKAVGGNIVSRVGASAGASALEEGSQEVAESVATKIGVEAATGIDQSLTEGTFADFVLGAIGGAGPGAVSGIPNTQTPNTPDEPSPDSVGVQPVVSGNELDGTVPQPEPVGLPAPVTEPDGAVPAFQEPEPTGPLSRAMKSAPDRVAPKDLARGDDIIVSADGIDPFAATFIEETARGVLVEDAEGNRAEIPRADFVNGMASVERLIDPNAPTQVELAAQEEARVDAQIEQRGGAPVGAALKAAEAVTPPPPRDDTPKTADEARERINFIIAQAKFSGWNTKLSEMKRDLEVLAKILEAEERGETNVLPELDEISGYAPSSFTERYEGVLDPEDDVQATMPTSPEPEVPDDTRGLQIDQKAIADEQAQEIAPPESVEEWDSATAAQREATLIQSGFATKAGKLNAPGKRLLESAWADIKPDAQKRIGGNPIPTESNDPDIGPMIGSHTRAGPTPTMASLPEGTFSGTEEEFASLSPGMRREIEQSGKNAPKQVLDKREKKTNEKRPAPTQEKMDTAGAAWNAMNVGERTEKLNETYPNMSDDVAQKGAARNWDDIPHGRKTALTHNFVESPKGKGKVAQKHGETDETNLPDTILSEPDGSGSPSPDGRNGRDPESGSLLAGGVPRGVDDATPESQSDAPNAAGEDTTEQTPVQDDPDVTSNAGDATATSKSGVGQLEGAAEDVAPDTDIDVGIEWDRMRQSEREAILKEIGAPTKANGRLTAGSAHVATLPWPELSVKNQQQLSKRIFPVLSKRNEQSALRAKERKDALKLAGADTLNAMEARHKEILGQEPFKVGGNRFTDLIAEGARTGRFNDAFLPDNKAARKVFEEFTGKKLPKTIKGTKQLLQDGAPFNLRDPLQTAERAAEKQAFDAKMKIISDAGFDWVQGSANQYSRERDGIKQEVRFTEDGWSLFDESAAEIGSAPDETGIVALADKYAPTVDDQFVPESTVRKTSVDADAPIDNDTAKSMLEAEGFTQHKPETSGGSRMSFGRPVEGSLTGISIFASQSGWTLQSPKGSFPFADKNLHKVINRANGLIKEEAAEDVARDERWKTSERTRAAKNKAAKNGMTTGDSLGDMTPELALEAAMLLMKSSKRTGGIRKSYTYSFDQWHGKNRVKSPKGKLFIQPNRALDAYYFNVSDFVAGMEPEAAVPTSAEISTEAAQADPDPTDAQKEAENYKKGHIAWNGLDITIENAKASERSGTDGGGKKWSVTMPAHYGYIKRTEGADGDHVDVYIGETPESDFVLIVDQIDLKTKTFDEHKVILGAKGQADAASIYKGGFSDGKGRARMGANKAMTVAEFKEWLTGDTTKPVALKAEKPAPAKPAQTEEKSTVKIDDFGEVLGGAAKHLAAKFGTTLQNVGDNEVANHPLSKTWPEPDYQKMIEEGVPPNSVAFIRALRDEVQSKPRKYGLKQWSDGVIQLRNTAAQVARGEITEDTIKAKFKAEEYLKLDKVNNKARMYLAVGHDVSLRGLQLGRVEYSLYEGIRHNPPKPFYRIGSSYGKFGTNIWPQDLIVKETMDESLGALKVQLPAFMAMKTSKNAKRGNIKFVIYRKRGQKGVIIGKKMGRHYIDLKPFDEVKDARTFMSENHEDLVAAFEKKKFVTSERKETNDPRVGDDYLNGVDVTPEKFGETFGFRGVQFGNYVEGAKRQDDLNNAYTGLMDLAIILDVPPKALSLNGTLGLAFGARGKGGKNAAAAHFEPDTIVINLTKKSGAGSLGHEWWHGMDNYFARSRGENSSYFSERAQSVNGGIRPEVVKAMSRLRTAIGKTGVKSRASKLDKVRSKDYWSTGREISARVFESHLIAKMADQGQSNDYLANVLDQGAWDAIMGSEDGSSYPYLEIAEVASVSRSFDEFFNTIETRETDQGVEMYSRFDGDDTFAAQMLAELATNDELFAYPVIKDMGNIKAIMRQIAPRVQFVGDTKRSDEQSESGADRRYLLRTPTGKDFYVYETDESLWIDVSRFDAGDGGNAVYAAIGDYAANAGLTFIGDPAGLSAEALRRRTEVMISLALRRGTTDHIAPHQYQLDGDKALGVPPLKWTNGDFYTNLQSLIEVSVESLAHHVPEIKNARYDFESGTFRTSKGDPLTGKTLARWSNTEGRIRAAGAGDRTLKRSILQNTLLREESGRQPGLLERFIRQSDKHVKTALSGTFYDRSTGAWPNVGKISKTKTKDVHRRLNAEMKRVGITSKVNLQFLPSIVDGLGRAVQGSQRGSEIKVSQNAANPVDTLNHEIIHALRNQSLWHREFGLFTKNEWQALVRAARADMALMEAVKANYPDLPTRMQTEEAVAELYRQWRAGEKWDDTTIIGKVEPTLRRIWSFFEAVTNALRKSGFEDHATVFKRIQRGDVGARSRGPDGKYESADAKFMRAYAETPVARTEEAYDAKERGFISHALTNAMQGRFGLLSLVPGRPLFAELGKSLPSAQTYLKFKEEMDAMRNTWHSKIDVTAKAWRKILSKNGEANVDMMDLMHDATIAGVDPSLPFEPSAGPEDIHILRAKNKGTFAYAKAVERSVSDKARKADHITLKKRFDALPPEFQEMFETVRDQHEEMGDAFEAAILANVKKSMTVGLDRAKQRYEERLTEIKDDGLAGQEKAEAIAEAEQSFKTAKKRNGWNVNARLSSLRAEFETKKVQKPYFPLMRFGSFFATVRDTEGKILSFSKFETEGEQKVFANEMRKNPDYDVEIGVINQDASHKDQVDPTFVADIEDMIGEQIGDADIMDSVWQRWLETLPDYSVRRSRIHRKGTPGYSNDAFRAFGRQLFHGSHQLARLEYSLDMTRSLEKALDEAANSDDPNRNGMIVHEMQRRHEFTMNPTGSAIAQTATSAAFVYYLGATPAAAIVNLTQTSVVGIPILGSGFKKGGAVRASRALLGALKDFAHGKGEAGRSNRLTAEEKTAMKEAYRRGTVDKSQSHDLAGISESGIEYNDRRVKVMEKISYMFHHAERLNREVTFLAAYRMARDNGFDHEGAIDKGADLTWKTHFDYQASSRPRLMQNDWLRVALVFKNFQINMLWRLFRDTHQALRGADMETRKEARTQLASISMSMAMHAGITGVWGYSLIASLLGMFFDDGSDEVEEILKKSLVDIFGVRVAGMMLKGVPGYVTGTDLTSRIGMAELWFRSPDRSIEGEDAFNFWLSQFAGAVPGMAENAFRGVQKIGNGEVWRGIETIVPKAARDAMQATRYVRDGAVKSYSGDDMVADVKAREILAEALGFSPARVSERYEANGRMRNKQDRITKDRRSILKDAREGALSGGIPTSVIDAIGDFNADYPEYAITGDTIRKSIRASQRFSAERKFGTRLNQKLDRRIRQEAAPLIFN